MGDGWNRRVLFVGAVCDRPRLDVAWAVTDSPLQRTPNIPVDDSYKCRQ
jgi:hypothetical protein